MGALWRRFGDPDMAEESVQEAFTRAAARWPVDGVPAEPAAWVIATAGNVALDRLRRDRTLALKLPQLEQPGAEPGPDLPDDRLPDDRLELMFACCHPALASEAQVALTLRLAGGLSTPEIARAFLVPEPVMAQRLVRAKRRLRVAGHRASATAGAPARRAARPGDGRALPGLQRGLLGLVRRRARPPRPLRRVDPARPPARLACCRPSRSRRPRSRSCSCTMPASPRANDGAAGEMILLEDQDRQPLGPRAMIAEGEAALRGAAEAGWAGVY